MVAATLAVAGCCVSAGTAIADPPAPPAPAPPGPAPGPAPAAPATTMNHDGTYSVGTDIVPGAYSSAGPVGSGTCYWKRVSSSGAIIDNALTKEAQVVQIDPGDASFKTNGCQPWQITDAPPPAPVSPQAAGAQLGSLLNIINNGARQVGDAPLPHP
jgi:hypothetical protein